MTQISLSAPKLPEIEESLRSLYEKHIQPARARARLDAMKQLQETMQQPGSAPTYPIRWDSAKQRRAFFASDGFGGGIPHKRTGAYQKAWEIIVEGLRVMLRNNSGVAKFISGDAFGLVHSGINIPQGWPKLKESFFTTTANIADREAEAVGEAIAQAMGR